MNFNRLIWKMTKKKFGRRNKNITISIIYNGKAFNVMFSITPGLYATVLTLASKPTVVYNDIDYSGKTGTGFVILPSRHQLQIIPSCHQLHNYKHFILPQGFNKVVSDELQEIFKHFSNNE